MPPFYQELLVGFLLSSPFELVHPNVWDLLPINFTIL
jgi:hypothetical protein